MIEFWYSTRCTREIKLIVCIATCIIIYFCSRIQELDVLYTGIAIAIGISVHLFRNLKLKIDPQNPYAQGFNLVLNILPTFSAIFLILMLPKSQQLFLSIQSLGFIALGFFIISIYDNRAKRF
jgi:hypothetical protein